MASNPTNNYQTKYKLFRRGGIYRAEMPVSLGRPKVRPVIILSEDNEYYHSVLACGSSKSYVPLNSNDLFITDGRFTPTIHHRKGAQYNFNAHFLGEIYKELIQQKLGQLHKECLDELVTRIVMNIGFKPQ